MSVSITDLALSISGLSLNGDSSGQPRTITITNTGDASATGLAIHYPTWPTGTTASSDCGASLAVSATCKITVTPNITPTSDCSTAGIAPIPGVITVSATGVADVTSNVVVLNYGCIYQGGYVFAMTETTDTGESIGGTVVTQTDQAPGRPNGSGIVWSSNGLGSATANVSYDIISGIAETSPSAGPSPIPSYATAQSSYNTTYTNASTYPFPSSDSFSACNGRTDGACNSRNILALYNATYNGVGYISTNYGSGSAPYSLSAGQTTRSYYAAGRCTTVTDGDNSDWYLPAICEMGPASNGSGCAVGAQNIVSQLPSLLGTTATNCTYGANCLVGFYWSSTEYSGIPKTYAWQQYFSSSAPSFQQILEKNNQQGVRCVRDFK